jgi:hypothetical protein
MPNLKLINEIVAIAAGGSEVINLNEGVEQYNITSATPITLASALNITATGQLKTGQVIIFRHDGGFTTDTATGKHISILGTIIPDEQALYEARIEAYYNGTTWKVTLFPSVEANQNIDGASIKTGTIPEDAITNNVVTNTKLATISRGSIKVGGTSDQATDLVAKTSGNIIVGDGTDVKSVAMSGDVTIDATGATTIGDGKITEQMLADDVVYDSGWKTINNYTGAKGFGLPAFTTGSHPKIRVIGRQVFIDGEITLPLDDGVGGLVTATSGYKTTDKAKVDLHLGTDDGYTILTGNDYGAFRSNQAMLPADLRPSQPHRFESNKLIFRSISDTGGTKSLILTSLLLTMMIEAGGDLLFATRPQLNDSANGSGTEINNSILRTFTTNVTAGDFAIEYAAYRNSFAGAVDKRLSTVTAFSYPATFDGENPAHLGGMVIDITTNYLIAETTSMADIKTAFDSI